MVGIDHKQIEVSSLGVDTDLFMRPVTASARERRAETRARAGYAEGDIVCIYTGRFASDKGPQILADAVDQLARNGEPFKALFVGGGTATEQAALEQRTGCKVHPFVPTRDLPPFYWAADIGVWPRQESTSQLDAAACGLPIILSEQVTTRERVDGNGYTYNEGSVSDLAAKLLRLKSADTRLRLGRVGSEKVGARFGWRQIAERRAADYSVALSRRT